MSEEKTKYSLAVVLASFVVGAILAALVTSSMAKQGTESAAPAQTAAEETAAEDAATEEAAADGAAAADPQTALASWNAKSASFASITAFVEDVCDESSENYVAPEDRVATFDMDGTILCEKAPVYMDYCLLMHRVLDDSSYKAGKRLRRLCRQLRANADQGIVDGDLDPDKKAAFGEAFAGMTDEEFAAYTNDFLDTVAAEGFSGMTYGESFYQPMIEVINYLRAHDFEVYIVSACEREVARAAVGSRLGIEPDHVLGTDIEFTATGQGDTPGTEYTVTQDDVLTMDGTLLDECGKANKVLSIQREIGKVPILSFGNSSGDFAMLNYAMGNPNHKGLGVFIIADDLEREYGNEEKAASLLEEANTQGWTAVSMRDDWTTIYGEGVEKTALVADQELADAA